MASCDLKSDVALAVAFGAENLTADKNGDAVDLQDYESAVAVVNVGASGDTLSGSVYWSFELEESDDNISYTDVADADLDGATGGGSGQFALVDDPAEDDTYYSVGYKGSKRYIRIVVNATGTHSTGTPISGMVVRGHGKHKPETNN